MPKNLRKIRKKSENFFKAPKNKKKQNSSHENNLFLRNKIGRKGVGSDVDNPNQHHHNDEEVHEMKRSLSFGQRMSSIRKRLVFSFTVYSRSLILFNKLSLQNIMKM